MSTIAFSIAAVFDIIQCITMRLCSACLLGIRCRYDGGSKPHKTVIELAKKEPLIPVCPEQLGGLSTPRDRSERKGKKVITRNRKDVTAHFKRGADEVVKIARIFGIEEAILKERSAACGSSEIYDGSFSGTVIKGEGVTAELLRKNNISVISEEEIDRRESVKERMGSEGIN